MIAVGYLLKGASLLLLVGFQIAGEAVTPWGVMGIVIITALWIFREKYNNYLPLLILEEALILALAVIHPAALILCGVLAYDLAACGLSFLALLLVPGGAYHLLGKELVFWGMLLALCALAGCQQRTLAEKERSFKEIFDRERRQRYSLEETKIRLTNTAREAARYAEIRERNRIAREIHDSLGHSLAGILMQLQAAIKTLDRDQSKARQLLQESVVGLAESVNLLRDTVYNIRPTERLGIDHFQRIIRDYSFCPIDFLHTGNLSRLSADHVQILTAILKEALTNASRHSQATRIEVQLEIRKNIVRLCIQDDGLGCAQVKEGMGITGMRERVRNAGGTISISSDRGFLIVCVLPREEGAGGGYSASAHC